MNRLFALIGATLVAAGCADRGVVDVSTQQSAQPEAKMVGVPGNPGLTVMTWNVYYGTDPKLVLADPVGGPAEAWALLHETDFPERADVLAQAIAAQNPQLVGLQEVAEWRTQHPSNFFQSNFAVDAPTVEFDLLTLLMDALEARGAHYVVGAVDVTSDLEVPMLLDAAGNMDDIRLTDRDIVLVRSDVPYTSAKSGVYAAAIDVPFETLFGTFHVFIREGWSSVVATVGGRDYRFVSTHLEIQDLPRVGDLVQYLQAQELLTRPYAEPDEALPTILVGDFNSDVASGDPDKTRSYDLITGPDGGFSDGWILPLRESPGLTCCQSDNLSNLLSTYSQRVDFIFTRNMPQASPAGTLVLARSVVGDQRGDRTPSGLWPSDHGGVVATFLVPPVGRRTVAE